MDYILPLTVMLIVVGSAEFALGLAFIAGHAWKKSPLFGILTIFLPPVAMYWAIGPFSRDNPPAQRELKMTLFFSGMIVLMLGLGVFYAVFDIFWQMMLNQG